MIVRFLLPPAESDQLKNAAERYLKDVAAHPALSQGAPPALISNSRKDARFFPDKPTGEQYIGANP